MKHIHFEKPGDPSVLHLIESPTPKPGKGEVLIQVKACGVNRPDILQRKGAYPPPLGASPVLGLEVAGLITECGAETEGLRVGDAVCALVSGGGYAEYCVAPVGQCLPIPKGWSMIEAAALPETFFTVWSNVFMRGKLGASESILIHGGSSGIGTTAIQLARTFGAEVFVTAGNERKCQACLDLGAKKAINYRTQDFLEELRGATSGKGVNLILDMVGGDYFKKNIELLAPEGRLVQIAFQKGDEVSFSLRSIMAKGLTVTGSTLRPRSVAQKSAIAAQLREHVWPLLEARTISVVIDQTFPLEQAKEAHMRMESSEHIGKIVLQLT